MPLSREEISRKIGSRIRQIRMTKGLSIEKLATHSEIDYTQLSRIERGKINTSIYYVYRICQSLCVPIQQLFEEINL